MPAALPPSDPPNAEGICSYLWIAHRGDAGNGGERAEGDGDFENADADADAQGLTSTSTSSSSCSAFACLRHPFVRALADGSLPPSSFRFYVAQDFHFLSAFSRAYALVADAAAAAGDGAAAATLVELQESVDEELGLHRGFAASWGVVLDGASSSPLLPRASAATTAYTSFLLDTADKASSSSSHSLAGIARALAAMVPCCRLYGWLGVKLKQQEEKAEEEKRADTDTPEAKKNPFASWIETYSSCEYHAATVKLEGLLDRLAEGLSAEERASKQTMRSPPGAAASSPSARKSSSSSSSSSASLRSPDMLQGLARGGLARRGSGAVAQALASPSPARPTKQIAGSAAARTTAAAPLARIGMQNDSPLPFFSIGASLATLFSRAMRLEHAFFTAAALGGSNNGGGVGSSSPGSGSKKPPPFLLPSLLVVDFDETLTAKDTTRLVIAAAASAASSRGDAGERARMEAAAAALVKRYVEEREALLERELPPRSSPPSSSSPSPSFSAAQTAAFLSELSAFDREANTRVFDSGILAGIARGELFELGKRRASESGGRGDAPLRPGAAAALAEACRSGVPTRVLSVSWSSELIQGALTGALQGVKEEAIEVSCDEAAWGLVSGGGRGEGEKRNLVVAVSANALEFDSSSSPPLSTGKVLRRVECADDKLEQFTALAASLLEGEGRERGPVVFVGDSPSDLGALLAADVGIVVAAADASSSSPAGPSKAELRGVAEALGIRVAPLAEAAPAFSPGGGGAPAREANSRTLFEAGSWSEVRRLLFGGDGASGGGAATAAAEASPFTAAAPPHPAVPRILSIAGSDSGGGAGIQADVKAASALGVFSATAVTAVTTQNSAGVSGVFRVPAATVAAQAEAVLSDIGADAIKTGMLADAETVEAVARVVERWRSSGGGNGEGGSEGEALHRRFPLVVDPVLVSTSGDPLASGGVASAMLSRLFPLATVVTPNLPEAAKLLGLDERRDLASLPAVAEAARRLSELGAAWVLVKGGHAVSGFADDADGGGGGGGGGGREAVDVLFERSTGAVTFLRAPRVETSVSHGTGCTLASAIACGLARGLSVPVAARSAKRYVGGALRASQGLRLGRGPQFPMNHGYATSACDWTGGEGLRAERTGEGAGAGEGGGGGADYRLYVVTDPRLVGAGAGEMRAAVAAAVRGGATVVQVRDKDAGVASLAASAAEAVRGAADGARGRPVAVLVNDRVDVAAGTAGAAGAHVGQGDLPAALARRALGHARLLGVSVRTPQQAVEAARRGADYVGAGAVFPTGTKEDAAVIGLHGLAEIVRASPVPVVAIGGVTAENAGDAIRAGASGVAVVSAVFGRKGDGREGSREEEVERAARAVRAAVDAAFAER